MEQDVETGRQRQGKITQRYLHRSSKDKDFSVHGGRMSMKSLPRLWMEFGD